ncbi:MAG: HigA family addiction module antidote protein [Bacteroidales bacterium]|nr:HigA family addiction module antidote protein [Bacteroidales bacterium]
MDNTEEKIPSHLTHPGEVLWEELKERKIKQKDFARQIALPLTYLREIIRGKRDINEPIAYKIEAALGVPYYIWLNLQNSYTYNKLQLQKRREAEKARLLDNAVASVL